MIEEDDALDDLLAPLVGAGTTPDPAEHPSDGTLSAYAEGKLAGAEELAVQEHLAVCGRCRDLLLEFASFVEVPLAAEIGGVTDLEAAREWRALQERMASGDRKATGNELSDSERNERLVRRLRAFEALAAMLSVAVVGLILYSVHLQGSSEFISSSESIYFAVTRSSHPHEAAIQVHLPCVLNVSTANDFSRYRVEIVSVDGQPMLARETSSHEGALVLRRRSLAPGDYKVRLFGLVDDKAEAIGDQRKLIVLP